MQYTKPLLSILTAALLATPALGDTTTASGGSSQGISPSSGSAKSLAGPGTVPPGTTAAPDTRTNPSAANTNDSQNGQRPGNVADARSVQPNNDLDAQTALPRAKSHRLQWPSQRRDDMNSNDAMHDPNVPIYPPSEREWRGSPN